MDLQRSDDLAFDDPDHALRPDEPIEEEGSVHPGANKTPLSSLLFKSETTREPLTEDNADRLNHILERVIGRPFKILVLIRNIVE